MHIIIHDWPDSQATIILRNIADAMVPGYSKLLLYEVVVAPGDTTDLHATSSDLTMMVFVAAKERTESMWKDLLKTAGLKITKIWTSPAAIEAVIEAELA